jgi:hypothetical protein
MKHLSGIKNIYSFWVLMNIHWQFGGVVWQEVPESHLALQHISQQVLSNLKLVNPQTVQKTN